MLFRITLAMKRKPTSTKKHVIFKEGELACIHLTKEHFSESRNKLYPLADVSFQILKRINDNAYKIELPVDYGVYTTLNVVNLSLYYEKHKGDS